MSIRHRALVMLAGVLAWSAIAAADTTLIVRDARNGQGLDATIELAPWSAETAATSSALTAALALADADGVSERHRGVRLHLPLDARRAARISHTGYRELLTVIEPAPALDGWTLWLQPQADADAGSRAASASANVLHGHVIDPQSLRPMPGVQLFLAGQPGQVATSDGDGAFSLPFPGGTGEALRRRQLVAIASDGRRLERAVALAAGSDLRLILDFVAGSHADVDAGHRHLQSFDARWQMPESGRGDAVVQRGGNEPPASIRVGFADAGCSTICCTGSCNHACVYDLETYVRRGLNDEWIASWNSQSLRAGSVAYRSYGAWHALNPVPGRGFDICSSACCQVNDGDTSTSTDQAVTRTAGLMLERNGAVFRSEYSAENNCRLGTMSCSNSDLSCGNGYAGSPSTNWPCLADPVGIDRDCFGHGRGMSQWGTQRWSLAPHQQSWHWQVNHYYNDNGSGSGLRTAVLTRVLWLDDLQPRQRTVTPGETLVIDYSARNLAATTHHWALLGASLRLPPDPYVDDPGNDAPANLPSGQSIQQRVFDLPAALPPGRYDLYGSLYLDIDENGAISSADLAQALLQRPGSVSVVAASDLIFYDGMQ